MNANSRSPTGTVARIANRRRAQGGVMLLEALIAILIFSVGVLSVVKLQVESVKQSAAAEYRSTAAMLANDVVSRMWASDRSQPALATKFGSLNSDGLDGWAKSLPDRLPNANNKAMKTEPTVSLKAAEGGTLATITLRWTAPGEIDQNGTRQIHEYVTVALVK